MIDVTRGHGRSLAWFTFGGYAGAIFSLTHWPRLQLPMLVPRSDLWVHCFVFGLWAILFAICRPAGPLLSGRNIRWSSGVAVVYAVIDELTQGLPGINRSVGVDDLGANLLGILGAVSILWVLRSAILARRTPTTPAP